MYHDTADAQMLTERLRRAAPRATGRDNRSTLTLDPLPLSQTQLRKAARQTAWFARGDGVTLLRMLGLLEEVET